MSKKIEMFQCDTCGRTHSTEYFAKEVWEEDPLEDREISELVYDVFCLLHSYDWYKEADTSEDTYRKDVKYFKDKWLNKSQDERIDSLRESCRKDYESVRRRN